MLRLIVVLLFIPLSGFSFIWPGLLKKIERCELVFDKSEVYPGNAFKIIIITTLKDSTQYFSNQDREISFADYEFELTGAAELIERTRQELTIRVNENAHLNPTVGLSIELRRKETINWQATIPVNYDVARKLTFKGKDGYDPRSGDGNGFKKIPLTKRINIEFVDNTKTLTNNSDPAVMGGEGPALDVYVSVINTSANQKMVVVEVVKDDGTIYTKYLKPSIGELEIATTGGKGGISKYGGKGGNGGNVHVYITKEAKAYYDQIFINNTGGDGGELWRPKIDGQQQGPYGDDGKLTISEWNGTRLEN